MKSIEASPVVTAEQGEIATVAFGPVIAHRIAKIRARLASGRYPLDVVTLADALVGYRDRERAAMAVAPPSRLVGTAVAERLTAAMRAMDGGAMLVLQLEFVEQLHSDEIAALFDTDVATIGAVRRSALNALSGSLSAG